MRHRVVIPRWIIYCIPVLFLMVLELTPAYNTADSAVRDFVYQSTGQTDPRISLIGIDEETLSKYGKIEVWGRSKLADLITYLTEDPEKAPAVIAVDIGVYSEKDPEEDARLTEAVRKAGNVVLVSSVSFATEVKTDKNGFTAFQKAAGMEEPFPELKDAALGIGHSNIFLDGDGYARHALGSLTVGDARVSSFAYTAARCYMGQADPRFDRENGRFFVEYSGLPGDYFGALGNGTSFCKVLEGDVPREAFRGNIVFIGAYATGMQDHYYITSNRAQMMNGVEIQANIAAQIINGRYYREAGIRLRELLIVLFGGICGLLLYKTDFRRGMLLSLAAAAAYAGCSVALFHLVHIVMPILSPVLVMILPCVIRSLTEYLNLHQERQRLVMNFSRYMPQSVAEKVAQKAVEGQEDEAFPGEERDIAVMFVDIRGFTTMSESMDSRQAAQLINSFLDVTTAVVFRYGGTIDKFIGDCTMVLFNAPLDQDDYVFRAISAALDIQKYIRTVPVDTDDPDKAIRVGIGIDCGKAVVGNIGSKFRMDYTAIGDTVNTASRMEGLAQADEILISSHVYDRVKDRISCVYRGGVLLKGKKVPTDTYLVTGIKDSAEVGK